MAFNFEKETLDQVKLQLPRHNKANSESQPHTLEISLPDPATEKDPAPSPWRLADMHTLRQPLLQISII
jgi:hypothetical protein